MEPIKTQDVWIRHKPEHGEPEEHFAYCFKENGEWGHMLDLTQKSDMVVMPKDDFKAAIMEAIQKGHDLYWFSTYEADKRKTEYINQLIP